MILDDKRRNQAAVYALLLVLPAASAKADTIDWVDWVSVSPSPVPGTVGLPYFVTVTGTVGATTITYTGDSVGVATTGTGVGVWTPQSTYQSATVTNAPATPDHIRVGEGGDAFTQTLTFSQPVTNPVMAIVSLGTPSTATTQWAFDAPFTILSSGVGAFGGGGAGSFTALAGNVLEGKEGNGTIQFSGTFSTIHWTGTNSEHWTGFTVGVATAPEPTTLSLLALGGLGGVFARRRRDCGVVGGSTRVKA